MKQIAFAFLVLVVVQDAGAGTVGEYHKMTRAAGAYPAASNSLKAYVAGLGQGMFWANVALKAQGKEKLYCPPPTLALNVDNYLSILDKEVGKPTTRDTSVVRQRTPANSEVTFSMPSDSRWPAPGPFICGRRSRHP